MRGHALQELRRALGRGGWWLGVLALALGLGACGGSGQGMDMADGMVDVAPLPDQIGTDFPVPPDTPPPDGSVPDVPQPDTPPGDGGVDLGQPDVPYVMTAESEPNDGQAKGELDPVALPAIVTGAIDPADDIDILQVQLVPGTLWIWELESVSGELAPHFGMTQADNRVPQVAAAGAVGGRARQEHFVLEGGTYYVFVRDARNVPADSSQHVGGPGHTWRLTATPAPISAQEVSFPSQLTDSLPTPTSVRLYRFSGQAGTGFDIVLSAERRNPASDMDSRMSLYDATNQRYLITNDDDVKAGTLDSHVGGELPATGEYILVVENVAPAPTRLEYDLDFTLR